MAGDYRDGGLMVPVDLAPREGGLPTGILPAPEALARYNAIVPGAAERILRMAEEGAEYQFQLERARIEADKERSHVAVGTATGIAALCVIFGFIAIVAGHALAGMVLAVMGVALLVGALAYSALHRRPPSPGPAAPAPLVREVPAFDL